jgi:hypothetical protein
MPRCQPIPVSYFHVAITWRFCRMFLSSAFSLAQPFVQPFVQHSSFLPQFVTIVQLSVSSSLPFFPFVQRSPVTQLVFQPNLTAAYNVFSLFSWQLGGHGPVTSPSHAISPQLVTFAYFCSAFRFVHPHSGIHCLLRSSVVHVPSGN